MRYILSFAESSEFMLPPTEPAYYTGSYTRGSKEIVDIEIAMFENAGAIITDSTIIAPRTKF
jgi:hypothetical protein